MGQLLKVVYFAVCLVAFSLTKFYFILDFFLSFYFFMFYFIGLQTTAVSCIHP